ncbi:RasGEF domain containing protein [Histomonas meleagridis]|uniref:RasGEF domain containing protein n=1 Tax=Histomonas meleagridis TaxID=135588 RepID=UPI00355A4A37|nr:RasGEF domain containing protein [Histomonas meleagridis]KAH0801283.1 RasGEF domain containing protein [Histomonas meleagridis]
MSFSTPRLILAFLITRYFAYKVNNNEDNLKLRDRVIHILDIWTSITSFQFDENMIESLEMFSTFLNDEEKNINHSSQVTAIIQKIKGNIKHEEKIQLPECPEPIINMNLPEDEWTLQNVHPLELARQVTLLHYSIFKQIEPNELLDDIWGDKKSRASVNIDHLVEHFTMFSSYVSLSIITGETAKVRGKVFKNWIDVAKQFLDLNNFHGVFSVILGLTHRSVSRMSNTMKYAMKTNSKRKKEYEKMLNICNISNDFQNYRSIITTAKEPCIPFIGCYQKDLIYVQETFPNKVNGLINFRKCQECYKLVKTIQDFQRIGYNFMEVPKIQKLLEYLPEPTDSIDLMKLSMAKEKKEKEKKK